MTTDWPELFNTVFATPASAVTQRVWRDVYGAEYPEGVEPYSYVSQSELTRFCGEIGINGTSHLIDIGCGRGGPGLWVAANTGVRLTGIDIAATALKAAEQRAHSLGLSVRAKFMLGSFDSLPLESASADAIMSVDAFLFAPDKPAAMAEMARVLRKAGRLIMTTWDFHSQPVDRPPQVADHRPLLKGAGLDVVAYDETQDWLGRQSRTTEGLMEVAEALAIESNEDVASVRKDLEAMRARTATMLRRVFLVAQRR